MTRFEPPYTEPYVRWCGRNGSARTRSYPIMALPVEQERVGHSRLPALLTTKSEAR